MTGAMVCSEMAFSDLKAGGMSADNSRYVFSQSGTGRGSTPARNDPLTKDTP
jgi:hypothetical protein